MKFIEKLQNLPLNQKLIITWSIVIFLGIIFSVWRINVLKPRIENLIKIDIKEELGIVSYKENLEDMEKGLEVIKESTETIKDSFEFMKEITDEFKNLENMEEASKDFDFLIENNEN